METSRVIVGVERPPSALDLNRARHKADERRCRRNRWARSISLDIVRGRRRYVAGEVILVLRDILVLDVVGLRGKADELRRSVCAILDGRTAREHLIEADLGRLVEVDPG